MNLHLVLVGSLFFLSGTAALIYQVVWMRMVGLHLGTTTSAVGTVVATFLGGLALGSALAGRWTDRALASRSEAFALRVYGLLELGIGIYALAFRPLLSALTSLILPLYGTEGEGVLFLLLRGFACAIVILPATVAMGATLPVLARYAAGRSSDAARTTGALYSANTLGGVAGAVLAGWVLLPRVGLFTATIVAALLNLAVGGAALLLSRSDRPLAPPKGSGSVSTPRWVFPAYALSGFAALLCEIAWTRGLILSFGSSVYAFSLTLAVFILGLAIGGTAGTFLAARIKNTVLLFGLLQVGVLILTAGSVVALGQLPVVMIGAMATTEDFTAVLRMQGLLASAVILAPAMLFGAMFPALCRLVVGPAEAAGAAIGRLYSWNTAGTIAGALAAAFVLLPWRGIPFTLLTAAACQGLLGAWAMRRALPERWWPSGTAIGLVVLLPLVPRWDLSLMATSPLTYGRGMAARSAGDDRSIREKLRQAGEIVYHRWDQTGLVTVHRSGQEIFLRLNGKTDASNLADMRTQILSAHLPLLLHPDPKEVLIVGLGSGASVAAALRHPVTSLDVVELSPGVLEASAFFEEAVGRWRSDERVHVRLTDARTYVCGTSGRYDVISAQPSNLWVSGMASLFTREHFERYRALLRPGGLVCQWVQGYLLPPEDFASVVATFHEVFSRCDLWEVVPGGDYLLVGGDRGGTDLPTVVKRFSKYAGDLSRWGIKSAESLVRDWIGSEGMAEALSSTAGRITDDFSPIEYTAPRGLMGKGPSRLLEFLDPLRSLPARTLVDAGDLARAREERRLLASVLIAGDREGVGAALGRLAGAPGTCAADPVYLSVVEGVSQAAFREAVALLDRGDRAGARRLLEKIPKDSQLYGPAYNLRNDLKDP